MESATSTPTIAFLVLWITAVITTAIVVGTWGVTAAVKWYYHGSRDRENSRR